MAPPRFFAPSLAAHASVLLDADESHHAAKVLRLRAGEPVLLLDGAGGMAEAVVEAVSAKEVACRTGEVVRHPAPACRLTIFCAIPKGPRAEDMVDQLTQLGCDRFVPLVCERSVVDPREGKVEKFRRAAREACKQAMRPHLMEVGEPLSLAAALAAPAAKRLIADPRGGAGPRMLEADTALFIGPEGGFTDGELAAAEAAGAERWRFSPHVLRIETAAAAACAILRA